MNDPEQRANILIAKFSTGDESESIEFARNCVDEIIAAEDFIGRYRVFDDITQPKLIDLNGNTKKERFWTQVKKELNKMRNQ